MPSTNRISGRLPRAGGHTVVLADPRGNRRKQMLRAAGRHRVVEAASLHEVYPLVESLVPDVLLLSADFLEEPELEGILRLAALLPTELLAFAEDGQPPVRSPLRDRLSCISRRPDDGVEELLLRMVDPSARIGASAGDSVLPDLILIGASTGGISALETVLAAFPADCPPTMVVQHIRDGYVARLVERLDHRCRPRIVEGTDGLQLQRGMIIFAADEARHLTVTGRAVPRCALQAGAPRNGHRPAVDALFESAVPFGRRVAAALLTGMGSDGAAGLGALRRAGAYTVAQDRVSSTVWGMPRVAIEAGAAEVVLGLPQIGPALLAGRTGQARGFAGGLSS